MITVEPETTLVLAIVFLSTLTRSTFGFGDALVAMPLLSLFIDVKIAAPLIALISMLVATAIIATDWRHVQLSSAWRLVVFSLCGIPIGLYYLTQMDVRIVKSVLAVLIVGFASYQLVGPRRFALRGDRSACVFGFFAGVLGGAYNTHGPPLIVYGTLRRWSAERFRATLQGYFLPTGLLILCGHWATGLWSPSVFRFFVFSLPIVLLAFLLGRRLNRHVRDKNFERYVHGILIVIGTMLLIQSVRG